MEQESMKFDVLIVGAGPAGLSAGIRLAQLAKNDNKEIRICIVEKGSEVGAHILSGAVLEPRSLNELLPNWQELNAPVKTPVNEDRFLYLTSKKAWRLPVPPQMKNDGNYIISLSNLCRFLAQQAENLGVEIYPGFAASQIIYDDDKVVGITTGDMGITKDGQKSDRYQPGMALYAEQTLFAEGARGSLTKTLMKKYQLTTHCQAQTYGIGLKELWEVNANKHQQGKVVHSIGWPLDAKTYGGSFIYHLENNQVAVGFVIGLDYQNPYLNPFDEFQRFKTHPTIAPLFMSGKRIAYGARALNEGGWQSIPKLTFPGGMLIGCAAGFLNVAKIKGTHTAMKSGMIAAETIFEHFDSGIEKPGQELTDYEDNMRNSWVFKELRKVRNIRPGFHFGLKTGLTLAAIDTYIFRGHAPWTLRHKIDHLSLHKAKNSRKIAYPKPDGKITFDKLSSVYLSSVNHEENQPVHLQLKDPSIAIDVNYKSYDSPEQRYCPACVYEIVTVDGKPKLQINAANCVHCKTCDIKDPRQNINWVPPEGGDGPNYPNM